MNETLSEMFREYANAPKIVQPSKYWIKINKTQLKKFERYGYANFKRTFSVNYFMWTRVPPWDSQIVFLIRSVPFRVTLEAFIKTLFIKNYSPISYPQSWSYSFLTRLLWHYVTNQDDKHLLKKIKEPLYGNPPRIYINDALISQDIANSLLEYQSIFSTINHTKINRIIELGPGYGRTAYFIKRFKPDVQYVFVDIPPALYIAQRYMKQVFPKSRIFNFRPFESYNEVRSEIEKADLVFLLPHQMEKLPKKWADMFINISSLHEMIPKQIKYYINQADRLTREYFYFKQWISDKMPEENIVISEKDYPIPKKWKKIYRRNCKVHTSFFESLYKI